MLSSPDFAPDSEFHKVEHTIMRYYKGASLVEVSPVPQTSSPVDEKLEVETVSTPPSELQHEPKLPYKKDYLLVGVIAILVATIPLAILVAFEYWPQPKLAGGQLNDLLMIYSRSPNLMGLLKLYSHKRVLLHYEFGSPLEALTATNVQSLIVPQQGINLDEFKQIVAVLDYIKPVSVLV